MAKSLPEAVLKRMCSLLAFEDVLRCRLVCHAFFQATSGPFDQACAQYTFALDSDWLFVDLDFTDPRIASVVLEFDEEVEATNNPDTCGATKANDDMLKTTQQHLSDEVTVFRLASVFERLRMLRKVSVNLRNTNDVNALRWMKLTGGKAEGLSEHRPEEVMMLWFGLTLRALSMSQKQLKSIEVGQGDHGDEIPLPLSVFQGRGRPYLPNGSPINVEKLSLHINCDVHDNYSRKQKDNRDKLQRNIEAFFKQRFIFKELRITTAKTCTEDGRSARWRLTTAAFSLTGLRGLTIDAEVLDVLPEEIIAFCRKNKETLVKLSLGWLVLHPEDMESVVKLLRAMRFRMPVLRSVALNIAWKYEDGTENGEQKFLACMEDGQDGLQVIDEEIACLEEYLECMELEG